MSVKLRGVNGEIYNGATKIPGVKDLSLTLESNEADASDHDSGAWGEKMTTTWNWSVDVSGWYLDNGVSGADATQKALRDAGIAGTSLPFKIRPNGTATNKTEFTGNGRIKNFKMGQPQDGVQPFDFSIVGVGALTEAQQT